MAKKAGKGKKTKRHEGIIATVAANVKRIREGKKPKKLSQEKLGFAADLDRTYISAVERRKRNITISVLARIAEALKVTPAALVSTRGSD
jgi:transcriptional regulator with XRE-family HTH domain